MTKDLSSRLFLAGMAAITFALTAPAGAQDVAATPAPAPVATPAPAALVNYHIVQYAIPTPLTSQPGNVADGKAVVLDRKLGNCLSCHAFPLPDADQGNVGPDLHGVGSRYTPAQLRLRVVNMKALDPATIMPAYYRVAGLHDVETQFIGKPMLTAQQIEDLVAYLASLKQKG